MKTESKLPPFQTFPKPRARKGKGKKTRTATLRHSADTMFSKFIRKSYAVNGMCECITCGKWLPWNRGIDAGHYVKRHVMTLRYDKRNVFPQCSYPCNRILSGNNGKYAKFIIEHQGMAVLDDLHNTQAEWETRKKLKLQKAWGVGDYEEVITRTREDMQEVEEPPEMMGA